MAAAAEQAGLNPDLTIDGQRYVLVDIYTPVGTTRNGFMTLFATSTEAQRWCSDATSASSSSLSSRSIPPKSAPDGDCRSGASPKRTVAGTPASSAP